MNQDFLEKINSGKFEISGVIKKIIYGNQYTDFYNGIKEIGDTINIIVKATKWEAVFHFKEFAKNGIMKNSDWDDFKF